MGVLLAVRLFSCGSIGVAISILESFRFDYEYDYEIRHFWRQLLASSRSDVIKSLVIAHLRTTFSSKLVLKQTMTTTLSRQHEMTRATGAKNDESRSRTRTRSQI